MHSHRRDQRWRLPTRHPSSSSSSSTGPFVVYLLLLVTLSGESTAQAPFHAGCPAVGCISCESDLQPVECGNINNNASIPQQYCYSRICNACQSSGWQQFVLVDGSCGCAAGHGLVRDQGPPDDTDWFTRVRRSRYGYMGSNRGRHLLGSSRDSSNSLEGDIAAAAAVEQAAAAAAGAAISSPALLQFINMRLTSLPAPAAAEAAAAGDSPGSSGSGDQQPGSRSRRSDYGAGRGWLHPNDLDTTSSSSNSSSSSSPPPSPPPPPPPPSPPPSSPNLTDRERERQERMRREAEARLAAKRAAEKALAEARMKLQLQAVQRIIARRYQETTAKAIALQRNRHKARPPPYPPYDSHTLLWVPCLPCPPGTVSPGDRGWVSYCTACPPGTVPNADQSDCVANTGSSGATWPAGGDAPLPPQPTAPAPAAAAPAAARPLVLRPAKAFTLAPRPVWVDLRISGGQEPFDIQVVAGPNSTRVGPKNGTITDIQPKRRRLQYAPDYTYCNAPNVGDDFYVLVTDAAGSAAATRVIVFADCPDQLYVGDDSGVSTQPGETVEIRLPVLGGAAPFVHNVSLPPSGGVVSDVMLTRWDLRAAYTPRPNYCSLNGFADYFEITVTERYNTTTKASVDVMVPCPPAPSLVPDLTANTTQGVPVELDMQLEGVGPFSLSLMTPPLYGSLSGLSPSNTLTYGPNATYCNSVTGVPELFFYTIYDAFDQLVDGAISVFVECVNSTSTNTTSNGTAMAP